MQYREVWRVKIAIINTVLLKDLIEEYVSLYDSSIIFETYLYENINDTIEIIPKIKDKVDGFFINGDITTSLIKKTFPMLNKPIATFNSDILGYYNGLLYSNINENIPFSRIYIDHISDEMQGNFKEILGDFDGELYAREYLDFIQEASTEELIQMRYDMTDRMKKAWDSGKFDVMYTRFSTIVDELCVYGVNAKFVFPSQAHIHANVSKLRELIMVERVRSNFPSVIVVTLHMDATTSKQQEELALATLKKEILEFRQIHYDTFTVDTIDCGYAIYTNEKFLTKITQNFTICPVRAFLTERVQTKFTIGYGIDYSMQKAVLNAMAANQESEANAFGYSYAKNERQELIGPLNSASRLVVETAVDDKISEIATLSGLSPSTIQRIMAVTKSMNTKEITSKDISDRLGITSRTANRFISKLENAGFITAISTKQDDSRRGRPSILYEVLF